MVISQLLEMYQSSLSSVFWPEINYMMKADVTCHLLQGFSLFCWEWLLSFCFCFFYFFIRDLLCILFSNYALMAFQRYELIYFHTLQGENNDLSVDVVIFVLWLLTVILWMKLFYSGQKAHLRNSHTGLESQIGWAICGGTRRKMCR